MKHWHKLLLIPAVVLISPPVLAHDNGLATGLFAGLSHPVSGVDHLAALVLAGVFIGRFVSGRRLALGGLLLALGLGAGGGLLLGAQAWVEGAILLSLPVFFALQWIRHAGRMKIAVIMMGLFMIAHGWAHGVAMGGMDTGFAIGFLLASAGVMGLSSLFGAALESRLTAAGHA